MGEETVSATVRRILTDVKQQGADAVRAYTRSLDGIDVPLDELVYDPFEVATTLPPAEIQDAIRRAAEQIRRFHERSRPAGDEVVVEEPGLTLRERWVPIRRAGIYVPNGAYPLISSLLMTAIPAQCAGVESLVVAISPRHESRQHPVWNFALRLLDIHTVLGAGGAQAIAALAYGIKGLPPVDIIAGPGNAYVAQAKQQVAAAGVVGIDVWAGPSEVAVIADGGANAAYIAADLLAQAEHGPDASAHLVTWDQALLATVQELVERQRVPATTMGSIGFKWVSSPEDAINWVNQLAPEHLGLIGPRAESLADQVMTAGAVFIGPMASEALGDYVAGPSHVLPTQGTGRFLSGLSTRTFMRKMSVIEAGAQLDPALLEAGALLARVEGLEFHRQALTVRQSEVDTTHRP
ncbi:MAG: histidinol dehydrogenase [Firmicutes bacterium]|nr:histidinol dehydrogenase [Bacillota bacterium]